VSVWRTQESLVELFSEICAHHVCQCAFWICWCRKGLSVLSGDSAAELRCLGHCSDILSLPQMDVNFDGEEMD